MNFLIPINMNESKLVFNTKVYFD